MLVLHIYSQIWVKGQEEEGWFRLQLNSKSMVYWDFYPKVEFFLFAAITHLRCLNQGEERRTNKLPRLLITIPTEASLLHQPWSCTTELSSLLVPPLLLFQCCGVSFYGGWHLHSRSNFAFPSLLWILLHKTAEMTLHRNTEIRACLWRLNKQTLVKNIHLKKNNNLMFFMVP